MAMTEKEAARVLNNAAQHSKQEILDALQAIEPRQRGIMERLAMRAKDDKAVTGGMKENYAAIRAAMGKER